MAVTNGNGSASGNGQAHGDRSFLTASVPQLVKQLTLDEKISLLAGKNFWEWVHAVSTTLTTAGRPRSRAWASRVSR